ncbi:MAG: hypothetical protein WC001_07330 [Desulfurivibrionaceae bacterium]
MDEFVQNLSSLGWWLGVVLVGLLLNLISAYVKPWLDRRLVRMSAWWQCRSEPVRVETENRIARLRNDRHSQHLLLAEEARHRFRGLIHLLLSLMWLLFFLIVKVQNVSSPAAIAWPIWLRQSILFVSLLFMFLHFKSDMAATHCQWLVTQAQEGGDENAR